MTVSSAHPARLDSFVSRGRSEDDRLVEGFRRLAVVLDTLRSSRSEGLERVPRIEIDVHDVIETGRRLRDEVSAVAGAFRAADAGSSSAAAGSVSVSDDVLEPMRALLLAVLQRRRTWIESRDFDLMGRIEAISSANWRELVFTASCPELGGDAYYSGGGALLGPDGRSYPLVVVNVVEDGRTYNASATRYPWRPSIETLRGADPGWVTIGSLEGVTPLRKSVPAAEQLAVAFYGANSGAPSKRRPMPASAYASLAVGPNGMPSVAAKGSRRAQGPTDVPPSLGDIRSPAFVLDGEGNLREVDRMQPDAANRSTRRSGVVASNPRAERLTRGAGAADLLLQAASGAELQEGYVNLNVVGYQALFEENLDGRRRAQLRTYRLYSEADGSVVIDPQTAHLGESGELEFDRLRFHYDNPVMTSGEKPYRVLQ